MGLQEIWGLDLEEDELAVTEIDWHLDIPRWEHAGESNNITPRDVHAGPSQNREHYLTIMDADLAYPVEVM